MNLKEEFEQKFTKTTTGGNVFTYTGKTFKKFNKHPNTVWNWFESKLSQQREEHDQIMELQHKRILEADAYWQKINNGDKLVKQDLGTLLKFLMDRIKELESKLEMK